MTELNDHELLAQYARTESEAAFATLVARYVNLVYSAALRFTGNPHHAEEITQAVFIVLARKAGSLRSGTVLSGWLYQTARLTAANFVKGEIRRQRREQEAYMQSTLNEPESAAWEQIAPLLDESMGRLGETDRNAIVLRFFENKTAHEVGAALKLNEAAAHKRVSRAVEKLRRFFRKRGVTLSATAIASLVAVNSVQAAPVGLAVTISATAAKGAAVAASITTLVQGTINIMTWLKVKLIAGYVAAAIIVAGGALILNLSGAGTNSMDDSSVAAFKNYLSRPPRISRIVYSELGTDRKIVAAVDGENLYYRAIKPGENPDLPIGTKNTMRVTPFVGRIGDMRWQIAGFNMTKAFHADTNHPDPITGFADGARVILNGILNLGSQHVEPGSFIWKGNEFEVQSSVAFNNRVHSVETNSAGQQIFKPLLPDQLTGKITAKNGVVAEMIINMSGRFTYEYDPKIKLPKGIPSRIKNDQKTYLIEKFVLAGDEGVNPEIFQPERYVAPELTMLKVVSNNITIIEPKPNKLVDQIIIREELKTLKPSR